MVPPSTTHPGDNISKKNATLTSSLTLTFFAVVNMRGLLLDVRLWTFVPQRSAPFLRPWTSSSGGYFGMFFFLLFHQGRPNLRLFNQLYWVLFSSVNIITVWQDFGWLGLGWDPRARIQFGRANFGVFSTSHFAPPELSSNCILLISCYKHIFVFSQTC